MLGEEEFSVSQENEQLDVLFYFRTGSFYRFAHEAKSNRSNQHEYLGSPMHGSHFLCTLPYVMLSAS